MTTKIYFILIAKTENKKPSTKEVDDTVDKLLDAASVLEKHMQLTLEEGEYFPDGTSLMLR